MVVVAFFGDLDTSFALARETRFLRNDTDKGSRSSVGGDGGSADGATSRCWSDDDDSD